MTPLRLIPALLVASLAALPVFAGGFSFDLPRLEFPAPSADATKGCNIATQPGCAPQSN